MPPTTRQHLRAWQIIKSPRKLQINLNKEGAHPSPNNPKNLPLPLGSKWPIQESPTFARLPDFNHLKKATSPTFHHPKGSPNMNTQCGCRETALLILLMLSHILFPLMHTTTLINQCHLISQAPRTSTPQKPLIIPPYNCQLTLALALELQKKPPPLPQPLSIWANQPNYHGQMTKTTHPFKTLAPPYSLSRHWLMAILTSLWLLKDCWPSYDRSLKTKEPTASCQWSQPLNTHPQPSIISCAPQAPQYASTPQSSSISPSWLTFAPLLNCCDNLTVHLQWNGSAGTRSAKQQRWSFSDRWI